MKYLEDLIDSQLEIIDSILTKREVDISERPSAAAEIFVKHCIVSVNGKSAENYIVESWFKYIILPIKKWYKSKYGPIVTERRDKIFKGAVIYNSVFYELEIPLRLVVPKGELRDYIFPKELLPIENELNFVKRPPNLTEESAELKNFKESIRSVVNLTRAISNNICTSEFKNDICCELSGGIQDHIQKAVDDILSGENRRF